MASSDESEARHATIARSCGSAHSCRRTHSFDQGRSDLWSLYHEGSHSRFAGVPLQPAHNQLRTVDMIFDSVQPGHSHWAACRARRGAPPPAVGTAERTGEGLRLG